MVARWLLPLLAAVAIFASSLTAWAATGTFGEAACCCPVPAKCKCHDHDGDPPAQKLKRCSGEAKHVTPMVLAAAAEPSFVFETLAVLVTSAPREPLLLDSQYQAPPETPPF